MDVRGADFVLYFVDDWDAAVTFYRDTRRWCTALGLTSQKCPSILFSLRINTRGGLADGSQDKK